MIFKLLNEAGDYVDKNTGERKNLLSAETAIYSPEGINVGCVELQTEQEALEHFNLEYKPLEITE